MMARGKKSVAVRFPIIPTKLDLTDKRQGFLALLIGILLAVIGSLVLPSFVPPGALESTINFAVYEDVNNFRIIINYHVLFTKLLKQADEFMAAALVAE